MLDIQQVFGISAGILELVACGIYIRSILKGETRPDRVTWWILTLVSMMLTVSYYASGARETIWLPLAYSLSFLVAALLSLKYGEGSIYLHTIDRISLAGALLSALVWGLLRSPAPALFMNICTELAGLAPTISKVYKRPWTEGRTAWILATAASLLNIFAIREWTFSISAYPVYVLATNMLITYFIMRKRFLMPNEV